MPRGSRPGERRGGRQKGTPNRKNAERIATAARSGMLPHEFLLAVSQGQVFAGYEPTFQERLKAASDAAPFYAPRLSSVEAKVETTLHDLSDADLDRRLIAAAAAAGVAGPPTEH